MNVSSGIGLMVNVALPSQVAWVTLFVADTVIEYVPASHVSVVKSNDLATEVALLLVVVPLPVVTVLPLPSFTAYEYVSAYVVLMVMVTGVSPLQMLSI